MSSTVDKANHKHEVFCLSTQTENNGISQEKTERLHKGVRDKRENPPTWREIWPGVQGGSCP